MQTGLWLHLGNSGLVARGGPWPCLLTAFLWPSCVKVPEGIAGSLRDLRIFLDPGISFGLLGLRAVSPWGSQLKTGVPQSWKELPRPLAQAWRWRCSPLCEDQPCSPGIWFWKTTWGVSSFPVSASASILSLILGWHRASAHPCSLRTLHSLLCFQASPLTPCREHRDAV